MRLFLIEYTHSKEHGFHDNCKQPWAMLVVVVAAPAMTVARTVFILLEDRRCVICLSVAKLSKSEFNPSKAFNFTEIIYIV